jgi:hypothetical protein
LSATRFQHSDLSRFKDEHRIGLVLLAEKELVRRDTHDRAQAEQELEDVGPDSTKNGHALQQFDSRVNAGVGCRQVAFYVSQMTPLCMG